MLEVRWTMIRINISANNTNINMDIHERGIGIILDERTRKSVTGYWAFYDRIVLLKLSGTPFDINVRETNAPTADKHGDWHDTCYVNLIWQVIIECYC